MIRSRRSKSFQKMSIPFYCRYRISIGRYRHPALDVTKNEDDDADRPTSNIKRESNDLRAPCRVNGRCDEDFAQG